ncbi:MAG: hypothetical protein N4Q32_00155 [Neisseriaceae bacterium]|nr:hypothetical protein [Neisseriaceae bacterium]
MLSLVACQNQDKSMHKNQEGYNRFGLPLADADSAEFKLNPNPQQGYRVKVTISDPPGPLKLVNFFALYQALNCQYTTNRLMGAVGSPEKDIDIKPQFSAPHQLEGIVYLDAMLDEDYYGQGTCEWKLTSVSAQFRASDNKDDTLFIIGGFKDELFPSQTMERYYPMINYPKTYVDGSLLEGNTSFGIKKERRNLKDYSEHDWFYIKMSVEEN